MNKTLLAIIAVIVVVGGGILLMQSRTSAPSSTSEETVMEKPETEASAMASATIEIKDFKHSPATLTVKPGETVSVTNRDVASHTVTSDEAGLFDTGLVGKDQTKTFTAPATPGTYAYHCTPHPNMQATLIVAE